MAEENILATAPFFIQRRYNSIRGYVRAVIETEFPELETRIARNDMEFIQITCLIYTLYNFFEDGHRAASQAVQILGRLRVRELHIGNQRFSRNSEATLRGRRLADELLREMPDDLVRDLVADSRSLGQLVRALLTRLEYA